MKTILDPSIIFISEQEWQDEKKRDDFIEYFLETFTIISDHGLTQIYWTDDLDSLLFGHIYAPPWISNKNWRNQLIPFVNRQFNSIKERVINEKKLTPCLVNPNLNSSLEQVINDTFLEMMHVIIDKFESEEDMAICLGVSNHPPNNNGYSFLCNCHDNQVAPNKIISNPNDWLSVSFILDKYWPKSRTDKEDFKKCLSLFIKKKYSCQVDDFPNCFDCSDKFISSLVGEIKNRKAILDSIYLRLSLAQKKAMQNKSLKDEPFKGSFKERRFKVNKVCRIHYKYSQKGDLYLLKYYRESEHDKALK